MADSKWPSRLDYRKVKQELAQAEKRAKTAEKRAVAAEKDVVAAEERLAASVGLLLVEALFDTSWRWPERPDWTPPKEEEQRVKLILSRPNVGTLEANADEIVDHLEGLRRLDRVRVTLEATNVYHDRWRQPRSLEFRALDLELLERHEEE